jgi:hypothetical protein
MSYDEMDAARDEFYEQISRELYPEHKEQAIEEFTSERLRSYYQRNPDVMRPAVDAIQEGNWQSRQGRFSAALLFYVEVSFEQTGIEYVSNMETKPRHRNAAQETFDAFVD